MPAILPNITIDCDSLLTRLFMPHQIHWILAENSLHAEGKQAIILAEKSVRIGWTHADAFKNVRKRIHFKNRDYLFGTRDYPSALEYMRLYKKFTEIFNLTSSIISHGEEYLKVPRLDECGKPSSFTDEIKLGVIKFDNGSRILAFSAHPQAMAVYGGDVGLDEFAKHSHPRLLWETAQGRIAWGGDLAIWSAHDGEDTLFNEFAREARIGAGPWNLYYRVTLTDAIELGLIDVINRTQGKNFTPEQYIADCRTLARQEEIFQQAYMCNPLGASSNHIVEWSAIERCRYDYECLRLHLEDNEILEQFGSFQPGDESNREYEITQFIRKRFLKLFQEKKSYRLGFDVAASGQGSLAVIYIEEAIGDDLWLRGLFTCRTEDWHFLTTVLFTFLRELRYLHAAGDETGLGSKICWEAAHHFGHCFTPINFSGKKHDLGFTLMNQLATAKKRFPKSQQDIAADFFALRKSHTGIRWIFSEARNTLNPHSHCDIAWAAALASEAHEANRCTIGAMLG